MKHFCWRACTESLLTLVNLYQRKVVDSPLCSSYGRANETVIHAIWDCDNVKRCWDLDFNKLQSQHHMLRSFADLLFFVRQQEENVELFTALAWSIWGRRNKCHFNEPSLPPKKLHEAAAALLAEFQGKAEAKPKRKKYSLTIGHHQNREFTRRITTEHILWRRKKLGSKLW